MMPELVEPRAVRTVPATSLSKAVANIKNSVFLTGFFAFNKVCYLQE
jgi:hypothetical protein